jgi:hypothetical protein
LCTEAPVKNVKNVKTVKNVKNARNVKNVRNLKNVAHGGLSATPLLGRRRDSAPAARQ